MVSYATLMMQCYVIIVGACITFNLVCACSQGSSNQLQGFIQDFLLEGENHNTC